MSLKKITLQLVTTVALGFTLSGCGGGSDGDITLTGNDGESADPVVVEVPIAYIMRPAPLADADPDDLRQPTSFSPGAELFVRSRASSNAIELNITDQVRAIVAAELSEDEANLAIDIKDLEPSFDGEFLLFSARVVPEPVDNNLENTTWNIWQYEFATDTASYVIPSPATRNEAAADGSSQDTDPHFLPDGRIVFSSTRQTANLVRFAAEARPAFIAADESGQGPASVLHIYDPDDNSFEQISFNYSHDIDPTVISTGEIVFSRWDNGPGNNRWSLYKINPSGRQLSLLYGYHSHDTGSDPGVAIEFLQPRQMEDGRLLTLLRPSQSTTLGGELSLIDINGYVDHDQPIWANQGAGGEAQSSLTDTDIQINNPLSPGGQYSAAYPLEDGTGRLLVSWNQCRATDQDLSDPLFLDGDPSNDPEVIIYPCATAPAGALPAPLLYGLWIFDPSSNTQLPVITPQEGFYFSEIVAAESRSFPAVPNDTDPAEFNSDLIDSQASGDGFALLKISSVYDFDGQDDSDLDGVGDLDVGISARANPADIAYSERPARYIRIVKPVPLPDPDNDNFDIDRLVFGISTAQGLREIIGYAPVEPDGSVTVKVPANIPFAINLLDARGRRINERHDVWLQLAEGEVRQCTGCHRSNSELPHGRIDSQPTSVNQGAISLVVGSGTGIGFPNTRVDRDDYPVEYLDGGDIGQTMAEIYDLQRPLANKDQAARELFLDSWLYTDEWADTLNGQAADLDQDYSYDAGWDEYPTVTNSQATYVNRLVINYVDHIQPIWERSRVMEIAGVQVQDANGDPADNCLACHRSNADDNNSAETDVPAGQLDLGRHIDDTYYRSYRELFFTDTERWLDAGGNVTDRIRSCSVDQDDGMGGIITVTIADPTPPNVAPVMRSSGANNSANFFDCFENGANCGAFNQQPAPPADCTEDGTIVIDPVNYNHSGWLADAELRLLSEWLDIGAQYYNNPFHPDLAP